MSIDAKICGLSTLESLQAAVRSGARYVGFVFFERSPRNLSAEQAALLIPHVPKSVIKTGVFVNPTDDFLRLILVHAPLDLIQLHGAESPERVAEVKQKFTLPVMKAIAVSGPEDIEKAKKYEDHADILLFDAKAPKTLANALPGGNGLQFDWSLIKGVTWKIPWMLSGGLDADNIAQAITTSGAVIVDVSSGVESAPGQKSIPKIEAFMKAVKDHKDKK